MSSFTFSFLGTKQLGGRSANSFARNRIKTSSVSSLAFVRNFNVCNTRALFTVICIRMGFLLEFYCG